MSRPKRVKKTPKTDDDFYVYSFKKNQSARACEATGVKEESNTENVTRMTDFYSKACNDYEPGMDLKKNQKLKKGNIRKHKRYTKSGLDVDDKVALTHDSHLDKSNDDNYGPFSAQSEEHHNSGFNASNDSQKISMCRQNTRSMARRRGASAVGPVDGEPSSSRPTTELPVPSDVPRKGRTTCSRKRRKDCEVAQSPPRNVKRDYTVIIEWLGLYSDEESDQEDVIYLVNKRSERRKKLKLIKNRNEYLHQHSSSSSSDVNEFRPCANIQGNNLVFNGENRTDRENISPEEPPARMDYESVAGCKLQGTCKLPSSDGATNIKSEAPVEAAVKFLPVDTATTSARYVVEDVIEISD